MGNPETIQPQVDSKMPLSGGWAQLVEQRRRSDGIKDRRQDAQADVLLEQLGEQALGDLGLFRQVEKTPPTTDRKDHIDFIAELPGGQLLAIDFTMTDDSEEFIQKTRELGFGCPATLCMVKLVAKFL